MMTFLEIRKTRDVNKSICEYQLLNTDCDKQPLTIKNKIQNVAKKVNWRLPY